MSSSSRRLKARNNNINNNDNFSNTTTDRDTQSDLIGSGYSVKTSSGYKFIEGINDIEEASNGKNKVPNVWAQAHPIFYGSRSPTLAHPDIFTENYIKSAAILTLGVTGTEVAKLQDPYTQQVKA